MILCVDDMLTGGVSVDSITQVVDEMSSFFQLNTLGKVRSILDIKVEYEMSSKQLNSDRVLVSP